MVSEFHKWGDRKPEPLKSFMVFEPAEGFVTMVRWIDPDEDGGDADATWCPHTGKCHYGDMKAEFLWAYSPVPEGFDGA